MPDPILSPEFLRQLERLELQNRRVLAGQMKGERRSRKKGIGLDFADYRHYTPGDDLRFIDWNLYARLDRLFVKIFHEEQDLQCNLLVDCSRSMDFGEPSKLDFARRLAAAIGYIGLSGQDKIALNCFSSAPAGRFGPARGRHQVRRFMDFLGTTKADGATSLEAACRDLSQRVRTRSVVVLISDFFDPAGFEPALRHLVRDPYEVYVVHVLSPAEIDPPLSGHLSLLDSETGEKIEVTVTARLKERYRRHLESFTSAVQAFCSRRGLYYLLAPSDMPLEQVMLRRLREGGLVK